MGFFSFLLEKDSGPSEWVLFTLSFFTFYQKGFSRKSEQVATSRSVIALLVVNFRGSEKLFGAFFLNKDENLQDSDFSLVTFLWTPKVPLNFFSQEYDLCPYPSLDLKRKNEPEPEHLGQKPWTGRENHGKAEVNTFFWFALRLYHESKH